MRDCGLIFDRSRGAFEDFRSGKYFASVIVFAFAGASRHFNMRHCRADQPAAKPYSHTLKIIRSFTDSTEAEKAVSLLSAAGIKAVVENAGRGTVELRVEDEDLVRAQWILDRAGVGETLPAGGFARMENAMGAPGSKTMEGTSVTALPEPALEEDGYWGAFFKGGMIGLFVLAGLAVAALVIRGGIPRDPASVAYVFMVGGVVGVFARVIKLQRKREAAALEERKRAATPGAAVVSVKGPVELVDGKLTLVIPLVVGGEELAKCARGIGEVVDEDLKVVIPDWLAERLRITAGSVVHVDNQNGKFNIAPASNKK